MCQHQLSTSPTESSSPRYYTVSVQNWKTKNSLATGTPFSPPIYAITGGAPTPPQNLGKSSVNRTEIVLTWSAPLSDGGSVITGYLVYKNDGQGGAVYADAMGGANVTTQTATVTGLSTGLYYKFKVAAINRVVTENPLDDAQPNFGEPFSSFIAVTPDPPAAPEVVNGTRTSTGITIIWEAPADNGGQLVTGYRLYRDDGATGVPNIIIWNGENAPSIFEFATTGLNPGSSYVFAVAAINTAGKKIFRVLSLGTEI